MKRIWSVLMLPCFVLTCEPSSSGSKSRWTPSEEASAEPRYSPREQILSISSMNTMPSCSTDQMACRLISSSEMSFSLSSSVRTGTASLSGISLFSIFWRPCILSKRRMISFIGKALPPDGSSCGGFAFFSGTSTSMSRSSRWPARSSLRNASLLWAILLAPTRQSRMRSSTFAATLSLIFSIAFALAVFMPTSTRSRMIWSTSLPTKPTSVNLVASTLMKGAFASFASRRATSVLPTPVGPIMRMFFGMISSRNPAGTCCLRHLLRSATATARFASAWPTMYRSRCSTIWRGRIPWSSSLTGGSVADSPSISICTGCAAADCDEQHRT
mmetsp:Transcript_23620/g.54700  ORF Transcript_23620/g.54700 Transcript_23620/m.54700 type:complete len:329 (-) Transcript_23620:146-1132(-)